MIAEWQVDADRLMKGFYTPETRTAVDRRHSTLVTGATLFAVADLIRRDAMEDA